LGVNELPRLSGSKYQTWSRDSLDGHAFDLRSKTMSSWASIPRKDLYPTLFQVHTNSRRFDYPRIPRVYEAKLSGKRRFIFPTFPSQQGKHLPQMPKSPSQVNPDDETCTDWINRISCFLRVSVVWIKVFCTYS